MTCEEFVAALRTDPSSHTRAFRATVMQHAGNCPKCERIARALILGVQLGLIQPENPEAVQEADRMCDADYADPEFREVAYGKPK